MAKLARFLEVTSDQLESLPLQDGRFVYTTDTKLLYRETSTERVLLSGTDMFISVDKDKAVWTINAANNRVKVTANDTLGTLSFSLFGN